MAKQRMSFEKRQRERAKRERREKKAQRKAERKLAAEGGGVLAEGGVEGEIELDESALGAESDLAAEGREGESSDSSDSEPQKVTVDDSKGGGEDKGSDNDTPPRVQGES